MSPVDRGPSAGIEQRTCPVGLGQLGLDDLAFAPSVVRGTGEPQNPQGHRREVTIGGDLTSGAGRSLSRQICL